MPVTIHLSPAGDAPEAPEKSFAELIVDGAIAAGKIAIDLKWPDLYKPSVPFWQMADAVEYDDVITSDIKFIGQHPTDKIVTYQPDVAKTNELIQEVFDAYVSDPEPHFALWATKVFPGLKFGGVTHLIQWQQAHGDYEFEFRIGESRVRVLGEKATVEKKFEISKTSQKSAGPGTSQTF